jgi:hypothetical protein
MFLVPCSDLIPFLKAQTNALEWMNVSFIIQYSNHRHVSANHVTIYRVEQKYNYNYDALQSIHG